MWESVRRDSVGACQETSTSTIPGFARLLLTALTTNRQTSSPSQIIPQEFVDKSEIVMHVITDLLRFITLAGAITSVTGLRSVSRLPLTFRHSSHKGAFRIFYQTGNSEEELPLCSPMAVCNRVDTYSTPWIERQCRCPGRQICSMSVDQNDDHTVVDKSRQFKLCEPVSKLPVCRYFRDVTWTFLTFPDNTTQQTMECVCPKNSVAYIFKHQAYPTMAGIGYKYSFACSPQSRLRCQRKEPCRLFTVKKRPDVEEVNTNTLCQCPHGHHCPQHHSEPSVISGTTYPEDHIRTYSGYCSPNTQ